MRCEGLDLERRARQLIAVHPRMALYQAHPAIGLDETLEHVPRRLSDRRLALRWSWRLMSPAEREDVTAAWFRSLLERLAADDELTFEVLAASDEHALLESLAAQGAVVDADLLRARGSLTQAAIERLSERGPGTALTVERDGLLRFVACGGWDAAGAWLEAAEAGQMQADLRDAMSEPPRLTVRPGQRLHQVHPAVGVRRVTEDEFVALGDRVLGLDWLALSRDEQRRRERDLLGELLAYARELGAPVAPEPAATDELMRPFDDDDKPIWIAVDGRTLIESWEPRKTGVWIAPGDTGALQERLTDAWWEPWQRRRAETSASPPAPRDGGRISRSTRAHAILWGPRIIKTAIVAGLLLAERALHPRWFVMLALVAAGLVLLIAVATMLERWYERS